MEGGAAAAATAARHPRGEPGGETTAADCVLGFYAAINARDIDGALTRIAEDCLYEDMIYSAPFRGRQAVKQHFESVLSVFPPELTFAIDDISRNDAEAVGMTWHVEMEGRRFPFSRGCSFYRCAARDGRLQIIYARDIPEHSTKPGAAALIILKVAAQLFRRFPSLLDRLQ